MLVIPNLGLQDKAVYFLFSSLNFELSCYVSGFECLIKCFGVSKIFFHGVDGPAALT